MQKHLFWLFVPLVLVPSALVAIWSSVMGLVMGSDGMGFGWTGQAARAFVQLFDQTAEQMDHRLDALIASWAQGHDLALSDDEAYVAVSPQFGRIVRPGRNLASLPLDDLRGPTSSWEFYARGSRVFFVVHQMRGDSLYTLLKEFDATYLAHLNAVMGSELVLYRNLEPALSTWRNRHGDLQMPRMTDDMKAAVAADESVPIIQVKSLIDVDDYRGLIAGEMVSGEFTAKYGVGESQMAGYHSILKLRNQAGETLAHLDIAAPRSAVIAGPLYGFVGDLVIFLIVAVLSVLLTRRLASSYSDPLTKISLGIHDVMQSITSRLPDSPEERTFRHSTKLPYEIAMLETTSEKLQHLIKAWHAAEVQLADSRKQLVHSAKMSALGEMAGGVAHEINNPLAIIHSRSHHIQKVLTANPPQIDVALKFAKIIATTSDRIAVIVKGLSTFSRSGEKDPYEVFSLGEVIRDTLTLCSERFRLHGIDLKVEGAPDETLIEGRPVQISQILLNLLNNARDAIETFPEKWIRLVVEDLGERIRISVTDSGNGIPTDVREKIMQPFFSTKEVGKGTGLGLSVSKGIAEEHQGTLQIDALCANTRFVLDLPKNRRTEVEPTRAA